MTTRCINSRSLSLSLTMYFLARTDSPGIGYRTVSRQQTDNCRNSCMNSLPAQAPLRCGVSYGPVSVRPSVWPPVQVGFLSKRIQGSSCCHSFWHGRSHQATSHCVLRMIRIQYLQKQRNTSLRNFVQKSGLSAYFSTAGTPHNVFYSTVRQHCPKSPRFAAVHKALTLYKHPC